MLKSDEDDEACAGMRCEAATRTATLMPQWVLLETVGVPARSSAAWPLPSPLGEILCCTTAAAGRRHASRVDSGHGAVCSRRSCLHCWSSAPLLVLWQTHHLQQGNFKQFVFQLLTKLLVQLYIWIFRRTCCQQFGGLRVALNFTHSELSIEVEKKRITLC